MKTDARVYGGWSPFGDKIGRKMLDTPIITYKRIGVQMPVFITKKECQEWINGDPGAKKVFGLKPGKVTVTIAWETKEASNG